MKKYILSIDQGTTGTTVAIVDVRGKLLCAVNTEFDQIFPKEGWVEHDPENIWNSVLVGIEKVIKKSNININSIISIGITNQRETVVAWDSETGKSIYNAIVWQCNRTASFCKKMETIKGLSERIKMKTGLLLNPYFSATKISWIIKNVVSAKMLIRKNKLRVGTIDTFLLWRLTGGKIHKTEVSNASRTLLMNLRTLDWDTELLKIFEVPKSVLPTIEESANIFGYTKNIGILPDGIPISGILGDQQAALFGQACIKSGNAKCTFGTGSFILVNTGNKIIFSKHRLITTVAWKVNGKVTYAIEGGAFVCGAAVQWLRDGLGIIKTSFEIEKLAREVKSTNGIEFIPALTGLGAPYWLPNVRGIISGITRGTNKNHLARATLEAMALQNVDILKAIEKDLGRSIQNLKVDGGASENSLLMQLQADYLGQKVLRPKITESTVFGAALMAGVGIGYWKHLKELIYLRNDYDLFEPLISLKDRKKRISIWHKALQVSEFESESN